MAATPTFIDAGTSSTEDLTFYSPVTTTSTGTVTSATDQLHGQVRSLKCAAGGSGGQAQATTKSCLADAGTESTIWMYLSPNATLTNIFLQAKNAANLEFQLQWNDATGAIDIAIVGSVLGAGSIVVPLNTWFRLSIAYAVTSTTVFTIQVYVEGVADALASSSGTLAHIGATTWTFGFPSGLSGATVWFSDIVVVTGGVPTDLGDIRCTPKLPFANGTTNGFTTQIGSGGSGYGTGHAPQVNERPTNNANGWSMVGAGSAVTEEYSIEGAAVGDVNIAGLTVYALMGWMNAKSATGETAKLVLAGTQTNKVLTSTEALFIQGLLTSSYPAGGTDIGIITSTTVTTVSLYECGVVVAYLAPDILLGQAVC